MVKKLVFWSALVAGGLFLVNTVVRPGSISTAYKKARATVERKISPEFELARIRDQIAQLAPEMRENIGRIAEEMVAVETLEKRVGSLQAKLDDTKLQLAGLTNAEPGTKRVSVNGRDYSVPQYKALVNEKLRTCKVLEREIGNASKVLDAKKQGVDTARQQLAAMKEQKEQMEVLAAEYEAELKTLQLEQTRSKIQIDDSRLAEIKQSFEKLRERIQVERNKTALAEQFKTDTLTVPEKKADAKDVVDEAREYLGTNKEKQDAVKN